MIQWNSTPSNVTPRLSLFHKDFIIRKAHSSVNFLVQYFLMHWFEIDCLLSLLEFPSTILLAYPIAYPIPSPQFSSFCLRPLPSLHPIWHQMNASALFSPVSFHSCIRFHPHAHITYFILSHLTRPHFIWTECAVKRPYSPWLRPNRTKYSAALSRLIGRWNEMKQGQMGWDEWWNRTFSSVDTHVYTEWWNLMWRWKVKRMWYKLQLLADNAVLWSYTAVSD